MQTVTDKRRYEKPVLEVCGSMIERTLCDDDCTGSDCFGRGMGFKGHKGGHRGHKGRRP
jgi:hypothetical protein